ncbi:MAG TPA: zinc ABC transporter substrate-binding protein [Saprospiraceae bacterium]|nr:zinc ABC transporter substrate-binding protein [Saprospiraceae bacterium]HNT21848.1 zinc ABC transporter substrate-binding protein [Saprospiraceae bacterium]
MIKSIICLLAGIPLFGQDEKPLILGSASIFMDMAKQVGGEHFRYDAIVPVGGDPHIYEPIPRDVQKCLSASLILRNGLTFEGWLGELIENSGTKARTILITEGIEAIESLKYKNSSDPHAWMTASNGVIYAENIRKGMLTLSPGDSASINRNFEAYKQKLEELDRYIYQQVSSIPAEKRILITSHDAFQYYGRRYGIRLEAVLGTTTDADVQTGDILRLNKVIRENQLPAVFVESTVNGKLLEQVARDNRIGIGGKLFSDSIGDEQSPAPTYYDMLKYNTDVIVAALTKPLDSQAGNTADSSKKTRRILLWSVFLLALLGGGIYWFNKRSEK